MPMYGIDIMQPEKPHLPFLLPENYQEDIFHFNVVIRYSNRYSSEKYVTTFHN